MIVSKTKRWGNSLGIRIPKSVAEELGLKEEQRATVTTAPVKMKVAELLRRFLWKKLTSACGAFHNIRQVCEFQE